MENQTKNQDEERRGELEAELSVVQAILPLLRQGGKNKRNSPVLLIAYNRLVLEFESRELQLQDKLVLLSQKAELEA